VSSNAPGASDTPELDSGLLLARPWPGGRLPTDAPTRRPRSVSDESTPHMCQCPVRPASGSSS